MLRHVSLLLCLFLWLNAKAETAGNWSQTLQKVTRAVVTIRVDAVRAFDTATNSTTQATGFVIDAERGLILTNRHVVQSGPVRAEALFSNREEVELKPVYRDPVHDFGIFRYRPQDLQFMKPEALSLRPDLARVGRDIRVVGNDAGEQLSILAGTLARLDRGAPYYGRGRYNDFNTFYYQSASGVSGGSSGSPVVDINGHVLALNAGGNRSAASSFFLPLDRVVSAVRWIQQDRSVPRGTLQTTFEYKPYDEVRRLGLRPEMEAQLRKVNHGVGLLVVNQVLPAGPADGILHAGDILLKGWVGQQDPSWLRRFDELEALLDAHVNETVKLMIERKGQPLTVELNIGDLHAITPDEYIEFGEAIVHDLSYQQARHFNRPVNGVYVAYPGYVFANAGLPSGAVILSVNNRTINTLNDMEYALSELADGQQASLQFITLHEVKRTRISVFRMDRRWFERQRCKRNDRRGVWDCQKLAPGPVAVAPIPVPVSLVKYKDKRAARLASSVVYVKNNIPYHVDGLQEVHYVGSGLIVDAENGLVVVDRNTVPAAMSDIRLVFAGVAEIPARVLFIHPIHNFAILQYQPELLGDVALKSASLKKTELAAGDDVWLVGTRGDQNLLVEKQTIASIDPLAFSVPQVPVFRESNIDVISLNNAPVTQGGVLTNEAGDVLALWASFSYGEGAELKQYDWGIPIELIQQYLEQWQCCKQFSVRSLEVEWAALSLSQARQLGLGNDWLRKFQNTDRKRQVLAVSRLVAGSDASRQFKEGDLLVAINGNIVRSFRDVELKSQTQTVKVTIVRGGQEIDLELATQELGGIGTARAIQWAGAMIQNPHRALAAQRGIKPESVYVSFVWWGSPASRYGLGAVYRIVEFEGERITNLDDFKLAIRKNASKTFIQLKVLDLIDRESVITLKPDQHYWPSREIWQQDGEWNSRLIN